MAVTIGIAGGGGGGGGAVTLAAASVSLGAYVAGALADGASVTVGALGDTAIQGDNTGSLSAKARGLNKTLADVYDAANHRLNVAIQNSPAVTVSSLPALATGANVIGAVTQSGTWNVTVNTALPTGANTIGAVTQSGTWNVTVNAALPTGANTIGAVTQASGPWTVTGTKTNNGGAPGATNTGVLPAIANAAAPSWSEGNQVGLSVDLAGNQRTLITSALPTGANVIGAVTQSGTWNVTVNAALPTGANVIGAVTQSGTWNVTVNAALPTGANTIGAVTGPGAVALATDRTTAAAPFSHQLSDGAAFYTGVKTGQLPSALVGGRVDVNVGAALPTGANVIGAVTQSGTWNVTVNTALPTGANTIGAVTQASGPWTVQGPAATGAAVSGNPLLCGAQDSAGNASPLLLQGTGVSPLRVQLYSGSLGSPTTVGDGAVITNIQVANTASRNQLYNGASYDMQRANVDVTLLASAARTTTQTSADITTYNCQGITVTLDMTVVGTGSVTLTINYKDPASGKYILLLSGSAVTTNVTNMYMVDPRLVAAANSIAQKDLGRVIQIVVTANNANTATYSVGYTLIPG